jgi:cytochrome c-type protein NapB
MLDRHALRAAAALLALILALGGAAAQTQRAPGGFWSGLRGPTPLADEGPAPRMLPQANTDIREVRSYPEQPPVVPHAIESYQIDANVNQCLSCHARVRIGDSGAPAVSITHYMDRDGQFLASVSPRRYFCNQCHVPQHPDKPPIVNGFVDIDTVLSRARRP